MGIQIEDGKGQGYQVGVTNENKLLVQSTSSAEIRASNLKGDAYSLSFTVTPTGAGDCFCYIKNTSSDDLNINSMVIAAASAEVVQLKLGDNGTPAGGTTATPVSRNTNYNKTATGTFQTGADITGLSGGSVFDQYYVVGTAKSEKYNWQSNIIMGQNGVFTMYAVTGAIALRITLGLFYTEH